MNKKKWVKEITAFNSLITCEVFDQQVLFHFGETELLRKQLAPHISKKRLKDIIRIINKGKIGGIGLGKTIDLGKGTLIYLYDIPKNEERFSVLVHEIYHAAMMITKKIGIEYSSEGEEAYAYLIGFLTKEIVHELKEKKIISFSS